MAGKTVIGELVTMFTANVRPYKRGMQDARTSTQKFTDGIRSGLGNALRGLDSMLLNTAKRVAQLSAAAAVAAVAYGVKLAGDFEKATIAIEVMLKSATKAAKVMKDLTTFAAKTPFQLSDLTDATKKLLAFGFSAEEVNDQLEMIGNLAAGIDAPIGELAEIIGKLRVQGRAFGEDINQLQGRGIPIVAALAQKFGVTNDKIKQMVADGEIGFAEINRAIMSLTTNGGQFAGMMERLSETLPGKLSTLRDAISIALKDVGQALIDTVDLKGLVTSLTEFVSTYKNDIVQGFVEGSVSFLKALTTLSSFILSVLDVWDTVKIGFNNALEFIAKFEPTTRAIGFLTKMATGVNVADALAEGASKAATQAEVRKAQNLASREQERKILEKLNAHLDRIASNTARTADSIEDGVEIEGMEAAELVP